MKNRLRGILKLESMRYICLASLISADNNFDKESIIKNLEKIKLVKEIAEEDHDEELLEFANGGIEILTRELNNTMSEGD